MGCSVYARAVGLSRKWQLTRRKAFATAENGLGAGRAAFGFGPQADHFGLLGLGFHICKLTRVDLAAQSVAFRPAASTPPASCLAKQRLRLPSDLPNQNVRFHTLPR